MENQIMQNNSPDFMDRAPVGFKISHNASGWYYDLLNSNGCEIGCMAYFETYDSAKLSAEREMHKFKEVA